MKETKGFSKKAAMDEIIEKFKQTRKRMNDVKSKNETVNFFPVETKEVKYQGASYHIEFSGMDKHIKEVFEEKLLELDDSLKKMLMNLKDAELKYIPDEKEIVIVYFGDKGIYLNNFIDQVIGAIDYLDLKKVKVNGIRSGNIPFLPSLDNPKKITQEFEDKIDKYMQNYFQLYKHGIQYLNDQVSDKIEKEKIIEMKQKKLKHVLWLYLYDSIDVDDLEPDSDDSQFIDAITRLMAESNGNDEDCIFKNYDLHDKCEYNDECNKDCLRLSCGREPIKVIELFVELQEK